MSPGCIAILYNTYTSRIMNDINYNPPKYLKNHATKLNFSNAISDKALDSRGILYYTIIWLHVMHTIEI